MKARIFSGMHKRAYVGLICLLLLNLLQACSSEPTSFYLLDSNTLSPAKALAEADKDKMPKVILQEVKIPAYLDRDSITTRHANGVTLNIAEFNSWGEDITEGAKRVLSDVLMTSLLEKEVLLISLDDDEADARKIFVFLHRFDGSIGGKITIDARWTVHTYDNRELVSGAFVDTMGAGADYASFVKAQSALLVKLAESMSEPIASALRKRK